ncbi:MAG: hypothetical protein PHZ09_10500 [Eubacteriales bacterium]|nr:hypothetical protein [Eubacteriales bacterium]
MNKNKSAKITISPGNVYDRLNIVITIIAISMVIVPYLYITAYHNFTYPAFFSLCLPVACVFFGYFIQWGFGSVLKIKRTADNNAYESTETFFKPHQAVLTLIIAFTSGFFVNDLITRYLKHRVETGLDQYYDKYTIIPAIISALAVFSITIGILIWFYPFSRIISIKTVLPLTAAFFINYMITLVYGGVNQTFVTFCLLIYIVCVFFLLNQSNVLRTFRITKTVKITDTARLYNLSLVIITIIILAIVLIITLSFTVGIGATVKMVLFFALSSFFRDENVTEKASDIAQSFNDSVFSGLIDTMDKRGNVSKVFYLLFLIIVLGVILFFIISRRRETWLMIKSFFTSLINNIMDFILNVIEFNKTDKESYVILDYRDEEIKMDEGAVKEYNPHKNRIRNSYRDFMIRLNTIQNNSEKLKYAYSVLTESWKNAGIGVKDSDTPREIMSKILYQSDESEIGDITEVFESIKYAETNVDETHSARTIDSICRLVKRYYD